MSRPAKPQRERWWHWKPTSDSQAEKAEDTVLEPVVKNCENFKKFRVELDDGHHINTISCGKPDGIPVVLIHGMGSGLGLWGYNLPKLQNHFNVYALDLPGFGRSGRKTFKGKNSEEAEDWFVHSIEEWRRKVGLKKFVLLGHSLGGYVSACYALSHPQNISHLILADPWGVGNLNETTVKKIPRIYRVIAKVLLSFTPLSPVRAAGPYGPGLITKFRNDISIKFAELYEDPAVVMDYIYHCNSQNPTGEKVFTYLSNSMAHARRPLIDRLTQLDSRIFVSFIYGSNTWIGKDVGSQLQEQMKERSSYNLVTKSGHHVYSDNAASFNELVVKEILNQTNPAAFQ